LPHSDNIPPGSDPDLR